MELVRESKWLRVFRQNDKDEHIESKLLRDEVKIQASEILATWDHLEYREKLDFLLAIQSTVNLTEELIAVLEFLVEKGDPSINVMVAPLLVRHPDKEYVRAFLMNCIRDKADMRSNYFQAVETLHELSFIPLLQDVHRELSSHKESRTQMQKIDLIWCSHALIVLTGESHFASEIRALIDDVDPVVSTTARMALGILRE